MSNYTPGPWAVDDGEAEGFFTRVLAAGNVLVAHCYPDVEDDVDLPQTKAVVANARLIAKAPDMKALLTRAADKLQDYCAEIDGDINDSLAEEIDMLLAEIKGE